MKNLQHFKKTEIGLIPNDWELKKFSEIFSFLSTGTYSRAQIHEEGDVGYIHYGDIHTKLDFKVDTSKYVSGFVSEIEGKPYARIRQGDLIIADASEDVNGIGKSIEVINQPANKVISGLHTFLARDIRDTFALGFKGYIDSNILVKKQYIKLASGLKVYSLSKANFDKIWLPIPPLAEQRKIAQALTDADNYISALEKLIEKKKMMKEGLMVRFFKPQLSWQESTLGDIADIVRGASPRPIESPIWFDDSSSIGWVRISDLAGQNRYLSNTQQKLSNLGIAHSRFVPKDSLIMSICATLGKPIVNKINVCIHDGFVVFNNLKINQTFLFYYLKFIEPIWKKQGQTGSQMNLNTDLIKKTHIHLPPNDVQIEYATILTNLDEEIEILESKHIKACQIKEGMMQKLLTGEIRLA